MHENIKAFHDRGTMNGNINVIQEKERLVADLETSMRDSGYVPVLDLDPQFTRTLVGDSYEFRLTIYGVKIKEDAWQVTGISSGKLLRSTTQNQ